MPEHVKREVLSCLRDLADLELQRRTWIEGRPGGPASPGELASQLFDDTALGMYLGKHDAPVFSGEIDALLAEISALLDEQDLSEKPQILLASPGWREIHRKASRAATLVAKQIGE